MARKTATELVKTEPTIITLAQKAEKWIKERDLLIEESATVKAVDTDAQLEISGGIQTSIQKHIKAIEKHRKDLTAPLDDLKKQIMNQEKELVAKLQDELARLKGMNDTYATKKAAEAEAARQRMIEEQAARMMKEPEPVAADNPFGNEVTFEPEPVQLAPLPTGPRASNNRMVTRYDFEILAPNQVPREFCTVDESKIREYVKMSIKLNREPEIPGVNFIKRVSVEAR
jgi:hypothetical protein